MEDLHAIDHHAGGYSPVLAISPPLLAAQDASPYTVLITGANRGHRLRIRPAVRRTGLDRDRHGPQIRRSQTRLQHWRPKRDNVHIEKLDVTSDRSVRALARRYRGVPIDVLINNAGILGDIPAQKYGSYDFDVYDEIIDVNFKGPLRMVEAFMDNVAAEPPEEDHEHLQRRRLHRDDLPRPGVLPQQQGRPEHGHAHAVEGSEAGPGPECARTDLRPDQPGVVDTGFAKNVPIPMITARESAEYCIAIIEEYTPDKSGTFFDYKGAKLPW